MNARGTSLYTSLAPLPSFCWGGALSLGHRRLRCIGTARGRAWSVGLSGVYTENGLCPCNRVLSCNDKLTAGAVDAARLLLARFDITPRTICVMMVFMCTTCAGRAEDKRARANARAFEMPSGGGSVLTKWGARLRTMNCYL